MEPETSQITTSGGWRRRGRFQRSGMVSEPERSAARMVARRSARCPALRVVR